MRRKNRPPSELELRRAWRAYELGMSTYQLSRMLNLETPKLCSYWRNLGLVAGRAPSDPRKQWLDAVDRLRARTGLERNQILWCALRLAEERYRELEAMYDSALERGEIKPYRSLPRQWIRAPYKNRMLEKTREKGMSDST